MSLAKGGGIIMAKKKRRHYKRCKHGKNRRITNRYDRHHFFWRKAQWSRGALRELRDYEYCRILLPKDTIHKYIHARLSYIPTPDGATAKYVLRQLQYMNKIGIISEHDPIERRLSILSALFKHIAQPTSDALKKQLKIIYEYKNTPSV